MLFTLQNAKPLRSTIFIETHLSFWFKHGKLVNQIKQSKHLVAVDSGRIPSFSAVNYENPSPFVISLFDHVYHVVLGDRHFLVVWHQIVQKRRVLLLEFCDPPHQLVRALRVELAWSQKD